MKYRNKPCEVCGEKDRSKRKVCLSCKTSFPSRSSLTGQLPFNRREEFLKAKKRGVGRNG